MSLTARDRYANSLLFCGLSLVIPDDVVNHLTVMHLDYVRNENLNLSAVERAIDDDAAELPDTLSNF